VILLSFRLCDSSKILRVDVTLYQPVGELWMRHWCDGREMWRAAGYCVPQLPAQTGDRTWMRQRYVMVRSLLTP